MLEQTQSRPNHTSTAKVYFNEFIANVLRDNIGSKKISLQPQKKNEDFLFSNTEKSQSHTINTIEQRKRFLFCTKMLPHLEF